jgi:hypothetical protein
MVYRTTCDERTKIFDHLKKSYDYRSAVVQLRLFECYALVQNAVYHH